ncbi:MAG TPA: efflux RND transporter periplasmic adaptor subunit [Vicinamibacterales bacterium]
MKHRLLLILVTIAVVTVSVAAYYRSTATEASPTFVLAVVTRGDIVDAVAATGSLQAVTTVQVGTQVSGTIKTLRADYNSVVKRGEVVAELEPSLFQTQVDQARATVVRLQADVERARVEVADTAVKLRRASELWDKQLIPRTDLETAEAAARQAEASLKAAQAQVTQAQASLNQAQVNFSHTIIRAPIDGVVISRAVDVGQTVAANMSAPTLFVIANDLSQMQVNASIDESDIGRIHAGQPVTFKVDAYPGETFRGAVSQVRLEPVTEQNVVSYVTIINVPNPDMKLKPGMTANVTVEIARADDVLRVPNSALRFRPATSGAQVWVMTEAGPAPIPVHTGMSDGATTAVVDGAVSEHTQVISGTTQASGEAAQTSRSPFFPQRPAGNRPSGQNSGRRQGGAQ